MEFSLVNASQSIAALTAAPTSPSSGPETDAERQRVFRTRTLAVAFAALGVAPFFLAFHGAPSLGQSVLFAFWLMPLGAGLVVAKTGRVVLGHAICAAALIGSGVAAAGEIGLLAVLPWLAVAQAESLVSGDRRLVIATIVAAAIALGATAALAPMVAANGGVQGAFCAGFALVHAAAAAFSATALRDKPKDGVGREVERGQAVIDTLGDLVISYDPEGAVDFVGPGCQGLLGVPGDDLFGRGLFERVHVADRPAFLKAIADAAHEPGLVTASFRLRVPPRDGSSAVSFLWIAMRAQRLPRSGVVALLRNISEEKRIEADLAAARQAVESASRSKDHFLANMSHELRTPLNAIIGFSEMLSSSDLRPKDLAKQDEYARIILQSGQHLLAVVNSILDMSKIQSGTFSINPEPFLIAPLIQSCCEIVTLKAQEGGIEVVRAESGGAETLNGDRRACKQILINLLSNAVKFTPRNGRVTILSRPDGNSLSISVTDTGIGIGADDLGRLGDPFFQAKSALNRPYEGTGLGLSVVRGLVGLHGGTISIESELGRGTAVTVRLPLDCRFVTPSGGSAPIETMARRLPDQSMVLSNHTRVKKIA